MTWTTRFTVNCHVNGPHYGRHGPYCTLDEALAVARVVMPSCIESRSVQHPSLGETQDPDEMDAVLRFWPLRQTPFPLGWVETAIVPEVS